MAIFAVALNTLTAAFFYSAERVNVLVHYEQWVDRGMPESPLNE